METRRMPTDDARRPRVLYVEDDPVLRWLGVEILGFADYEVLDAGSVREAIDVLLDNEVDAAVLDRQLPFHRDAHVAVTSLAGRPDSSSTMTCSASPTSIPRGRPTRSHCSSMPSRSHRPRGLLRARGPLPLGPSVPRWPGLSPRVGSGWARRYRPSSRRRAMSGRDPSERRRSWKLGKEKPAPPSLAASERCRSISNWPIL